jgi:hypothetical protein
LLEQKRNKKIKDNLPTGQAGPIAPRVCAAIPLPHRNASNKSAVFSII